MKSTSGVYEIRNTETGHCYIGSSVDMQSRKRQHFRALRQGKHHSQYLQRAFDKYGEEAFEFCAVEEVPDKSMLIQREQHWIETHHPKYNMNPLATNRLGAVTSEETKARLREHNLRSEVIQAKKDRQIGVPRLPETIEKIKEARAKQETTEGMLKALEIGWNLPADQRGSGMKGKTHRDETKAKMRESQLGKKHTEEAKEKQRQAKLGKKQSPEHIQKRSEGMRGHEVSAETRKRLAETSRNAWAKKSPEERRAIAQNRPPITEETRNRLRESHLGQKSTPEANAKRIATFSNKTEEEKQLTIEKRKATWAKKRESIQPKLPGM